MMFWFKKKEIVVDCFTHMQAIGLNYPIDRAIKFYPKEFKSLPKEYSIKHNDDPQSNLHVKVPTIKSCDGVVDLYSSGFMIPAWDTFSIEMIDNNKFTLFSSSDTVRGDCHPRSQYGNEIFPNSGHVKLFSPWSFKEKTGVKFLWSQPTWNCSKQAESASLLPAVVDFKYQFNTHISYFVRKGSTIKFNIGDPLVHLIPMSDHNVKIKIHVMDQSEWQKHRVETEKFAHIPNHRKLKYPNFFEEPKKCPFGFGK